MTKIWIDADACPKIIKEIVFKATERLKIHTILVANTNMFYPTSDYISLVVVDKVFNEADSYVIEKATSEDLVITSDIPMSYELVKKKVTVLTSKGKVYSEENISEALATRNLMETLRGGGMVKGGPLPFSPNDKQAFANSFNKEITRLVNLSKN